MLLLPKELLGDNWFVLALCYAIYRIGSVLIDYTYYIQEYIIAFIGPQIIQRFNSDNREGGSDDMEMILHYLAEHTPFPTYRETSHSQVENVDNITKDGPYLPITEGKHILYYRGKYVFAVFSKNLQNNCIWLRVDLYAISRDTKFFGNLRAEAYAHIKKHRYVYVKLAKDRTKNDGSLHIDWNRRKLVPDITFKDAIIPIESQKDIENAFARYNNPPPREIRLKIPRRLTILLSGPPGFGKTTLITAIAKEMDLNIYATSLSQLTDGSLPFLFDNIKKNSCLVFEDIDSMTVNREEEQKITGGIASSLVQKQNPVSLSAFLNFLDGIYAAEGSIIIMTTNYPEKLDSALIRGERVHLHIKFGPNEEVYERWTRRFYDVDNEKIQLITQLSMKESISTSSLQTLFRANEDIDVVISTLQKK